MILIFAQLLLSAPSNNKNHIPLTDKILNIFLVKHCVKSVRIRSYSGPNFPEFSRIRTEYGEILSIPPYSSECGKMREKFGPE